MRTLPHQLSVVLLALLLGTLPGCLAVSGPLVDAAGRGDSQRVRALLSQGERGGINEALWKAGCKGHTEVAQLLLEQGANVNYEYGYSVLQCAAKHGHASMVSLLLSHGANRDYQSFSTGGTALYLARQGGHTAVVKILEDAPTTPAASPSKPLAPAPSSAESPPPPIY